jgi:HPt (histidine-containing phosphotransfer) domain-containing protein
LSKESLPIVEEHIKMVDTLLVDRDALLDRVGGDEDLMREITAIFLAEYPELIQDIERAVAAGDAKGLERAAHSLKGSVSNFGAEAATQAAYRLEAMGRKGQIDEAPAALAELLVQFQQLHPVLEELGA